MQKVMLIGNVGGEVAEKTASNGKKLLSFSLAVSQRKSEPAVWYECVIWEERMEMFSGMRPYIKRGAGLCVVADLAYISAYIGKDGTAKAKISIHPLSIDFSYRKETKEEKIDAPTLFDGVEQQLPF